MARGELAAHALVCPRAEAACAVAGCGAAVALCDLPAHMGGSAGAVARHVGGLAAVCFCKGEQVPGGAKAGRRHWTEDAGGAAGAHACRHRQRWLAAWGDACPRLSARTARQQRHSRELWRHCAARWPLCVLSCRRSTMSWPSYAALFKSLSQEGQLLAGIVLWQDRGARTAKAEPPLAPLRLPALPPRRLSRSSARLSSFGQLLLPHPRLPPSRRAQVVLARTRVRGARGYEYAYAEW